MKRRPPGSKRTDTLFPYTTLVRATRQTADLALAKAANAQTAADDAATRADAAQQVAVTAQTNADLARSIAESASANADAAKLVAGEALKRTEYLAINGSGDRPTATGANAIAMGSGANAGEIGRAHV